MYEKDIDKAFRYIMASINNGVYDGYYDLGFMYMKGFYFDKDFKSAIDKMAKGGNYGDVRAQNFLGRIYAGEGHLVTEDDEASFSWFMKAAEKGDEYAMSKISYYYYSGFGVSKDEDMAFLWAKKIEGLEEPNIILFAPKLALFYENGVGTPKNNIQAVKYQILMGSAGSDDVARLRKKMTEEEFQEAVRLANEWQAEHRIRVPRYYQ